ncbi:hypothetical protein RYZ26_17810 [Terasakiella sp. A23]|uniref:hypothetical protein n=1 Tax=Terasakiella sp. FCG-A23 TaxID=3080561 RepID=UPI002954B7F2|nr:hypothetical protein [Terasakiella sp. A23]MDV7341470.1 hypothetical protein [Terasakiella sp. A23]
MLLFRASLIVSVLIWVFSIVMWMMPEDTRFDHGLYNLYTSTYFELPLFCLILGVILVFKRQSCPSKFLFKATMLACWGYILFPIVTSGLLILVTFLGITGY